MKVAYVTAGGAGMYCGSCMRDNTLVRHLRDDHECDVVLVPTFTPIRVDEPDASLNRVFLGGVSVYLEQRWPAFGRLPRALRGWLDRPALLRAVSRLALQTRREGDGELAVSLLRGEHGRQREEIAELAEWLADELRPDLVNLTNLLIAGFVPALRRRRDVPVLVTLQGDDLFLDALPDRERPAVLRELRRVARTVDGFVVFSEFYRRRMSELLEVSPERFHVVRLGLDEPAAFAPPERAAPPRVPTLGYLARIGPEKGFHVLVEAFLRLRARPGAPPVRLRAAGWLGARDRPFVEAQHRRLEAAGLGDSLEIVPLPDRAAKIRFLHEVDVVAVPTTYPEPKGLFALEALAAGRPVVLPAHGAFPELAREAPGIVLVPPDDPDALAATLAALLDDGPRRRRLGEAGRRAVVERHDARDAARDTLEVWRRVVSPL